MKRPTLIFDGDCGFCRRWIKRMQAATGTAVDYQPFQTAAGTFPGIEREECERAVQWIGVDGRRAQGAEAVFLALSASACGRELLTAYRRLPGFAAVSEAAYRLVARHRRGTILGGRKG